MFYVYAAVMAGGAARGLSDTGRLDGGPPPVRRRSRHDASRRPLAGLPVRGVRRRHQPLGDTQLPAALHARDRRRPHAGRVRDRGRDAQRAADPRLRRRAARAPRRPAHPDRCRCWRTRSGWRSTRSSRFPVGSSRCSCSTARPSPPCGSPASRTRSASRPGAGAAAQGLFTGVAMGLGGFVGGLFGGVTYEWLGPQAGCSGSRPRSHCSAPRCMAVTNHEVR
jgi:hypothetical protein